MFWQHVVTERFLWSLVQASTDRRFQVSDDNIRLEKCPYLWVQHAHAAPRTRNASFQSRPVITSPTSVTAIDRPSRSSAACPAQQRHSDDKSPRQCAATL